MVERAIKGMLPHNALGSAMGKKLFVYAGADHKHSAQKPEVNDPNLIMDIVQSTNLITVISSLASYYRPNLVAIPLEGGNYSMVGCVHMHKDSYRKRATDVFVKMLQESAQVERISKGLD